MRLKSGFGSIEDCSLDAGDDSGGINGFGREQLVAFIDVVSREVGDGKESGRKMNWDKQTLHILFGLPSVFLSSSLLSGNGNCPFILSPLG